LHWVGGGICFSSERNSYEGFMDFFEAISFPLSPWDNGVSNNAM
jgi:hypothetical protein